MKGNCDLPLSSFRKPSACCWKWKVPFFLTHSLAFFLRCFSLSLFTLHSLALFSSPPLCLSLSALIAICAIIMAHQWEFDWCLSDSNKQGWCRGMLSWWEKIKQIRGCILCSKAELSVTESSKMQREALSMGMENRGWGPREGSGESDRKPEIGSESGDMVTERSWVCERWQPNDSKSLCADLISTQWRLNDLLAPQPGCYIKGSQISAEESAIIFFCCFILISVDFSWSRSWKENKWNSGSKAAASHKHVWINNN